MPSSPRAEIIAALDELGDDGIALVMMRRRDEGDGQLRLLSYGEGRETEFLGLLGYGTAILHRDYFQGDD